MAPQQQVPQQSHCDTETMCAGEKDPRTVLHWYDFICPFCYVAQQRNAILRTRGLEVVELAFQAHLDIPIGGIAVGPRSGPIYASLEREARAAGLPLHWPARLPNTRTALAAAEWVRRNQRASFAGFNRQLFEAHFALAEDLEDQSVIDRCASDSGVDLPALHAALEDGSADRFVNETETIGRKYGVRGTPAWLLNHRLISGLRSTTEFQRLAERAFAVTQ